MLTRALIAAALVGLLAPVTGWRTVTKTQWDCCKPGCAWQNNLRTAGASGNVKLCNKDDSTMTGAANTVAGTQSSCASADSGSFAYLCSDYSPRPYTEEVSLGFGVTSDTRDCCKCFDVQWTNGPASGKRIILQMINNGGASGEISLIVPGGGVNNNTRGCDRQYGYDWGRQYGGVDDGGDCVTLPDRLQGGCYWRWNWAKGDINGWQAEVRNITCPYELVNISGCGTAGTD